MNFTDEASQWQLDRIMRLLDERCVTGRQAQKIIMMLEDSDVRGAAMGHNKDINNVVKDRMDRDK